MKLESLAGPEAELQTKHCLLFWQERRQENEEETLWNVEKNLKKTALTEALWVQIIRDRDREKLPYRFTWSNYKDLTKITMHGTRAPPRGDS